MFRPLLESFTQLKAVVVGDLMLDDYIFGRAKRISPEAPVMVIQKEEENAVPGGAANVAKNISALGAQVTVIGVVGDDAPGRQLESELCKVERMSAQVVRDPSRVTTQKTRIVADHSHQVLRIDSEGMEPLGEDVAASVVNHAKGAVDGADVLILSDYLKGVLTPQVAAELVKYAVQKGVSVAVNPKPKSAHYYRGAGLVSLNRPEIAGLVGEEPTGLDHAIELAGKARSQLGVEGLLVTLGEMGLVAEWSEQSAKVQAPRVEVYDTAGAGDTVIATTALGMASTGLSHDVLELAARTSACVVRHVGVAVPDDRDLEALLSQ